MTHNINTPTREAIVVKLTVGQPVPCLDIDPIRLPVDVDGYADVFDANLIGLIDGMITWDALDSTGEYLLVWSSDRATVKGVCPACDEVFPVSEGYPVDLPEPGSDNLGICAVACGCGDKD